MEQKILANADIQAYYMSEWLKVLKYHDEICTKQFTNKEAIREHLRKLKSEPEIFQLPIHWKNDTLFLHFRVSIANELCKEFYSQSQCTPITDFHGNSQCIYWTKVEQNVESYAGNKQPILAVPYFSGKNELLIIDGNHRLTYCVNHNVQSIRMLVISEKSVIEQKLFSSSFDEFLYIFNNEIYRLALETEKGNRNSLNLIQKSYLCGKGFQF